MFLKLGVRGWNEGVFDFLKRGRISPEKGLGNLFQRCAEQYCCSDYSKSSDFVIIGRDPMIHATRNWRER